MNLKSDEVKNWVTAASIIVGGVWAIYEWNTFWPKTNSEVQISAATLRARTLGDVSVVLSEVPQGELGQLGDFCRAEERDSASVKIPLRIVLNLSSNAPIPVRVEITDFLLAELLENWHTPVERVDRIFSEDALGELKTFPLSEKAFIGGLNWTTIEPQGRGSLAVVGSAYLPFSCAYGGSYATPGEYAFGVKATIQGVNDGGTSSEVVDRYFYKVCNVNPDGGSTCTQQASEEASSAASTFKVIAQ